MSTFNLGLPTDIQWKRVCVSESMLDPIPCDENRPPLWRPSLALFRYDPADEYQPWSDPDSYLKDYTISYFKVVVTLAPYDDDNTANEVGNYLSWNLYDNLPPSRPCYGAILQVGISPTDADITAGTYSLNDYPYFSDFEPKKREIYEMRTESGEVLGGSHDSLEVGNSATRSRTTESFSRYGAGIGGALIKEVLNASVSAEHGNRESSAYQEQDTTATTLSTERRETQSHTTQLSQLYTTLQSFHLGTNRAMFFIEPRPHIIPPDKPTYIKGPRALEGVQEFFLVSVRPKEMTDVCVNVHLETMHYAWDKLKGYEEAGLKHQMLFLVGRDLCCCTSSPPTSPELPYVTYEKVFREDRGVQIYEGPATEDAIVRLRKTSANLKEALFNSVGSPERYNNGDVPFTSSDTFLRTVNRILYTAKAPEAMTRLSNTTIVPVLERDRLVEVYGDVTVAEAMNESAHDLSLVLGKTVADTLALKSTTLQAVNPGFTPPVGVVQPRRITAVQVSTGYPDPQSPRLLASMSDPTEILSVQAIDGPDVIDITFNDTPDTGTVSSQTFVVVQGGQMVTGAVTSPTPSTGRFTASQPLAPGLYGVRVLGDGSNVVKFNSIPLDGEPISLPTGDGVAGGDFYFVLEVHAAT